MNSRKRNSIVRVHRFNLNINLPQSIDKEIQEFVQNVLEKEFKQTNYEIAIVLTSNNYIKELNKQYLGHNYPTDVLCFPYSKSRKLSADIIISVEKAKTQAKFYNNVFEKELFFIVAHGILHLLGWDDSDYNQRKKMWAKQKELLNKLVSK